MLKRSKTIYLKFTGLLILCFILWRTDIDALFSAFAHCNYYLLPEAFCLGVGSVFVKSIRWKLLLGEDDQNYPLFKAARSYFSSAYIGLITPGRVGEFIKVYYLQRDIDYPAEKSLATVVIDRLLDLWILIIIGIAGLFYFSFAKHFILSAIVATVIFFLLPMAFIHPRLGKWFVLKVLSYFSKAKFSSLLIRGAGEFFKTTGKILSVRLVGSVLITCVVYLMVFAGGFVITQSLGIEISFIETALLLGLSNLFSLLPISIAGLGTRDAVFVSGFTILALPEAEAIAFSTLIFGLYYLGIGVIGFACFLSDRPPKIFFKQ